MNKTKKMVNKKYRRKKRNAKAKKKEEIDRILSELADKILNSYIQVAPGVYFCDDLASLKILQNFSFS